MLHLVILNHTFWYVIFCHICNGMHSNYLNNKMTSAILLCWTSDFVPCNFYFRFCTLQDRLKVFLIVPHFFIILISLLQTDSMIICSWNRHLSMRHYKPYLMIICLNYWLYRMPADGLHECLHTLLCYFWHWMEQTGA